MKQKSLSINDKRRKGARKRRKKLDEGHERLRHWSGQKLRASRQSTHFGFTSGQPEKQQVIRRNAENSTKVEGNMVKKREIPGKSSILSAKRLFLFEFGFLLLCASSHFGRRTETKPNCAHLAASYFGFANRRKSRTAFFRCKNRPFERKRRSAQRQPPAGYQKQ